MSKKNIFGGGNPNSLYVPMTDVEQEVLSRLVESNNFRLVIKGWGYIEQPKIKFGDARIQVLIDITFQKPETPIPVRELVLSLQTQDGKVIFEKTEPITSAKPLLIGKGLHLVFAWEILIHHLNPAFVKKIKPGAIGLTSRRLDKDTGQATLTGNMQTTELQRRLLKTMQKGSQGVK